MCIEELNRRMKSETKLSHPSARDKLFAYNDRDKNLNKPFEVAFEKLGNRRNVLSKTAGNGHEPHLKNYGTQHNENLKNDNLGFNVAEVEVDEALANASKKYASTPNPQPNLVQSCVLPELKKKDTKESDVSYNNRSNLNASRDKQRASGLNETQNDLNRSTEYVKKYQSIGPGGQAERAEADVPVNTPEFQEHVTHVKQLLVDRHYKEALDYLYANIDNYKGQQNIENLRLLSIIYFKMKNYPEAERYLNLAIDYLHKNLWLAGRDDSKRNLYVNLAILYLESSKFEDALKLLNDPVFRDGTPTLPFSYFSLIGDALTGLD